MLLQKNHIKLVAFKTFILYRVFFLVFSTVFSIFENILYYIYYVCVMSKGANSDRIRRECGCVISTKAARGVL